MITAGSLLAFITFWWLVLGVLAHLGGWTALAEKYPATSPVDGVIFRLQSARFGWVDYNGVVTIQVATEGLRISVMLPFRPGHPPMLLPWSALHVVDVTDKWYRRQVSVEVGSPSITKIQLPLKLLDRIPGQ